MEFEHEHHMERLVFMVDTVQTCLMETKLTPTQKIPVRKAMKILYHKREEYWDNIDNINQTLEVLSGVCVYILKLDNMNKAIDNCFE